MLMERGAQPGCDLAGVRVLRASGPRVGRGEDDAGRLGLQFDGAIEVEVPVEPVIVVAQCGENEMTSRR
jgi:hypothetical protein